MAVPRPGIPQDYSEGRLHSIDRPPHMDSVRVRTGYRQARSAQPRGNACYCLRVRPKTRAELRRRQPLMIAGRSGRILRMNQFVQSIGIPQREEDIELHALLRGRLGQESERLGRPPARRHQEYAKQCCKSESHSGIRLTHVLYVPELPSRAFQLSIARRRSGPSGSFFSSGRLSKIMVAAAPGSKAGQCGRPL
jgi:hypothetical protein